MLFMSVEHVDAMNQALAASESVRVACEALPIPRKLCYQLADGPDGETVYWTMTVDQSVQFALQRVDDADIVFTGDWTKMIHATRANRNGDTIDPHLAVQGDRTILTEIGSAFEAARSVGTLPVEFPEV